MSEVTFHPHSYGDPAGRVFLWNGELYRGIRSEWAPFFTQLLQNGVIERLTDRGLLVDTQPTLLSLDGFEIVVRHRYVPFTSYPEEWCATMLKDAALTIIDLLVELERYGLSLKDGHGWNLLFDAGRFVYVDLASIVPLNADRYWPGYDCFCRFCLHPLILMSHGQDRIARRLLPESDGILRSDLLNLTKNNGSKSTSPVMHLLKSAIPNRMRTLLHRRRDQGSMLRPLRSVSAHASRNSLISLRRTVEEIRLPDVTVPSHQQKIYLSSSSEDAWTAKHRTVDRILTDLKPTSVLDLSCGAGFYSKVAESKGSRVVSLDASPNNITRLYCDVRDQGLSILPLLMDFADPTPARGLSSHWAMAATQRLQCDLVLLLAPLHDMLFKSRLRFEQIVEGFSLFSKRWLAVEFVPPSDMDAHSMASDEFSWYTLDTFANALRHHFCRVNVIPSQPNSRVLVLCEK